MHNLDFGTVLIIIFFVISIFCGIVSFFVFKANYYIINHKDELFNNNHIAKVCKDMGSKLAVQRVTYFEYIDEMGLNQTYSCSSSIVSNAENNPIKYLFKYSNLGYDKESLEKLEFCNDFLSNYYVFRENMKQLSTKVNSQLPLWVYYFSNSENIPYIICDLDKELKKMQKSVFHFSYVSPAGQSFRDYDIVITSDILKQLESEVMAKLNKKSYAKTQRNAMTNDLREAIKLRDNYTCCMCGNSVYSEPNLLLEVDHIVPVAKGGKTEAGNLQTLCWRCNRSKSDKVKDYL